MDDGGKGSYGEMILHTRSYSLEGVLLLQKALFNNFDLKTRIIEKVKNQWVIVIPVKQTQSLASIVLPHMHNSILYKL